MRLISGPARLSQMTFSSSTGLGIGRIKAIKVMHPKAQQPSQHRVHRAHERLGMSRMSACRILHASAEDRRRSPHWVVAGNVVVPRTARCFDALIDVNHRAEYETCSTHFVEYAVASGSDGSNTCLDRRVLGVAANGG